MRPTPPRSGGAGSNSCGTTLAARRPPRPWPHPGARRPAAAEEKPDGGDYRAPTSFPLWSGNLGNRASGDGGVPPRDSGREPNRLLLAPEKGAPPAPPPRPPPFRGTRELRPSRPALCGEQGWKKPRLAARVADCGGGGVCFLSGSRSPPPSQPAEGYPRVTKFANKGSCPKAVITPTRPYLEGSAALPGTLPKALLPSKPLPAERCWRSSGFGRTTRRRRGH